jgi:hypothetical protein
MPASTVQRFMLLPVGALLATALAGCSGTTYGTGVSPEKQTLTDVMSIASLGSDDRPPIDYKPRGGIVVPPNKALPTPMQTASASTDVMNWPNDPDVARRKKREELIVAPNSEGSPNLKLAPGQTSFSRRQEEYDEARRAEGKKAWQNMRASRGGSYDAEGNPTRKYLTEPPVAYRAADPNAPMTEPEKVKKKFDVSKLWPF